MTIALVIGLSQVSSATGAAGVTAPSADSRAQGLTTLTRCPHAHRAIRFYSRRLNEWRAKMGAGEVVVPAATPSGDGGPRARVACPQTLAHVLQRKALAQPLAACPPNTKPAGAGCIPRSAAHVVYGERCRSARRATAYYRALTHERQTERGGELSDRTPIVRSKTCRWARFAAETHRARAKSAARALERWRSRILSGEAEIRAYVNDDCLEEIIDRESAGTWSPTVYNYSGSGAYGLPQALPGSKMASAGSDWRTNPRTQIRWMRGYVKSRYGGSCGALSYHNANGWY